VVHHTSLWEGERDRQQERVFEKNEKKKIEWEKRTKKQTHIFKETLGQNIFQTFILIQHSLIKITCSTSLS